MNYIFNKYVLFAIATVFAVGAFGAPAHAQYYNYNNNSYAPNTSYGNSYYNNSYAYPQYYPLTVSCYATVSSSQIGQTVNWYASASGGNGSFYYTWVGDEGLNGYGQSVLKTYTYPGYKSATVTVTSGGQTISRLCNGSVNVAYSYNSQPIYSPTPTYYPTTYPTTYQTQPIYAVANNSGLNVGCYSDPTNATVNQPVTWSVEVTGGLAPYTYSWTGSDGLSGSQISVTKYYSTSGSKSAIVTVTSADGRTVSHACSNSLAVASAYHAPKTVAKAAPAQASSVQPAVQSAQVPAAAGLSAASLFSLSNVPWGWIAILVILVLFFTVMYLLFNKQKI